MRASSNLKTFELERLFDCLELVRNDCLQIFIGDLNLAICQILEPCERATECFLVEREAHLFERFAERVPAGMLPENDLSALDSEIFRAHDLVGESVLNHAVLMNA